MSRNSVWEVAWEPKLGRYYYLDRVTGVSTWMRPKDCPREVQFPKDPPKSAQQEPEKEKKIPKPEKLPDGWQAIYDNKEKKYFYFNEASQERTWFKPCRPAIQAVKKEADEDQSAKEPLLVKPAPLVHATHRNKNEGALKHQNNEGVWDAKAYLRRLQELSLDPEVNLHAFRCALAEVKTSNDEFVARMVSSGSHVPETHLVLYRDCMQALKDHRVQAYRLDPAVSISRKTTASAISFFAQDEKRVVCALNFASGLAEKVGGEYASAYHAERTDSCIADNDNQEEDLCRRIGFLYASLDHAKQAGLYPFGPSTCSHVGQARLYRDVLYTPYEERHHDSGREGIYVTRGPKEDGFPFLPDEKCRKCCIISAAPPYTLDDKEIFDNKLIFETITSIFVAPVFKEPRCTTLVLGAWGCGRRHGMSARKIAPLFAQAIAKTLAEVDTSLGKLYHEIHFAIPDSGNYSVFKRELERCGLHLEEFG